MRGTVPLGDCPLFLPEDDDVASGGVQHLHMKSKFPDWNPARGMPYEDVENIRPETEEMARHGSKSTAMPGTLCSVWRLPEISMF